MGLLTLGGLLVRAIQLAGQAAQKRIAPDEVQWPCGRSSLEGTSFATGIEWVILHGDPSRPGLYTTLLRVPPDTRIDAHAHPDDRVATVVSGMWYFGCSEEFGESLLNELPAGRVYTEPPGANHVAMTRDEGMVVQMTGMGPTGTTYVDPDLDPSERE